MRNRINRDYLYTEEWSDVKSVRLATNSLYIHAHDPEDRSLYCASMLSADNTDTEFVEVSRTNDDIMNVAGTEESYPLNSVKSIAAFYEHYNRDIIYIEVTGMSCRIATPLMNHAIKSGKTVYVVYTEPAKYDVNQFKNIGLNKDLSETVEGISPLPGLISLIPDDTPKLFVALLGFEGGRFSSIVQDYSPVKEKITPIIGVPGYLMHYPYVSFWGNQITISKTKCWQNVKYAEANSIVDAYMLLKQISYDNRGQEMVVAPIGTKPHAIGAILYALKNPKTVELIYDNPKRSIHRTHGIGKIHVCNVSKLFTED